MALLLTPGNNWNLSGGLSVWGETTASPAPEPDPNFASVSLLLHMDSLPIVDRSSFANNPITVNDIQITSDKSPFTGGKSAYFNGISSFIKLPNITLASTTNFTVEVWFYPEQGSRIHTILVDEPNFASKSRFLVDNFQRLLGSNNNSGPTVTIGAWNHLAYVRKDYVETAYVNGVGTTNGFETTSRIYDLIGSASSVNGEFFWLAKGWMADLRITPTIARYTTNFTPSASPFADS